MRIIAPMMILIMMTSTLAGCTGGDPDGGGNDEIDMDILNQLIDDNLQDFINNTTIEVTNNYYDSENSTTINYVNGTSTMTSSLHAVAGIQTGTTSEYNYTGDPVLLLIRQGAFSENDAAGSWTGLNGANICVGIGTEIEGLLVESFSSVEIGFSSVGVVDSDEATDKLVSGECDAMAGSESLILQKNNSLNNDYGYLVWVSNYVTPYATQDTLTNTIELSIFQNSGYATTINEIYATITLTGTCISCTGNSTIDNIVEKYVIQDMTPPSSFPFFGPPEYSTFGISQCEYSLEEIFTDEGFMFGPGLECEHQIRLQIDYTGLDSNYDYTWSDLTYYLLWSMTPVEMN